MKKILILIFPLLLLSLCVTPTVVAQGILQLKITDKVENVTSLILNIDEIKVHKAFVGENVTENFNETTEGNETNETDNAGWVTVFSGSRAIDLITIINVEELLGESGLDAGRYTQIRLSVDNATVTVNGTSYDVKVPSKNIKFVHPFIIESNKTTSLVFDFDADKSIVEAGKKYILKPVVKVFTEFEGL